MRDVVDYGCAGRGLFDQFAKTEGKQIDVADHFFFQWKKCTQCVVSENLINSVEYDYDLENDHCGKICLQNYIVHFL